MSLGGCEARSIVWCTALFKLIGGAQFERHLGFSDSMNHASQHAH